MSAAFIPEGIRRPRLHGAHDRVSSPRPLSSAAQERVRSRHYRAWQTLGMAVGALAFLVTANMAVPTGDVIEGAASVIDGDGLRVDGQSVRLYGIDAVERDQTCRRGRYETEWACGRDSAAALEQLAGGRMVSCEVYDTDIYDRPVARCTLADGTDVGGEQVREGWAVAYTEYSVRYVADELAARAKATGIWGSYFDRPSDWRREHRS